MNYLRASDFASKISIYDFQTLLDGAVNPLLLFDAELRAQEHISLFLRKRYDLPALFRTFPTYVSGLTYTTGDTVWYSSTGEESEAFLYTPKETTSDVPTGTGWTLNEPRYPLIVDWMVTISLFKLHERVSPENIPTHRKDSYDEAMMLLKKIQEEKLSPDFPEAEDRSYNIYITGKEDSGIGFYY